MSAPDVTSFFDKATNTVSHIAADTETKHCAIIDPLLDYDHASGRTLTQSAAAIADHVTKQGLSVAWIIDTHIHADHLSAAPYLKGKLGGKFGIGDRISQIQNTFGDVFNAPAEFRRDGSQFDHLLADGETYKVGSIEARAIHTPGDTPARMVHVIEDAAFVGDTLFMPDYGNRRLCLRPLYWWLAV
ncbi:MAG: MBL fold metallo-hydrolase [Erythrobacter sp.]|nr:MBL fold metallo-hydrolase [Erythrobacter sp.]